MLAWALGALNVIPAYIIFNIDPILVQMGGLAIHWYGLAYVVAISVGLWALFRWCHREGIHDEQIWSLFVWAAIAGLVGGRLYFVIQQPDLVSHYLLDPINIIAVWNGGMAFFGAVFLASATIFVLAPRYGLNRWIVLDGGALFAAVGQIFGRFGNIINGDILGMAASNGPVALPSGVCAQAPCIAYVADPHILPWAIVYTNPGSFAPLNVAFQPAPVYEMLMNIVILAILLPLRFYLPRIKAGYFFTLYLALYGLTQLVVFFWRGSEPITPFLGIDVFKQAQWTGIFVMLACIPLFFIVRRFSGPWTYSAANPTPLPSVAGDGGSEGGGDGSGATTPALVAAGVRATSSAVAGRSSAATSTTATIAPTLPRVAPRAQSTPPAPPPVELPPWQPYRPRPGELRNRFGAARRSAPRAVPQAVAVR